MEKKEYLKRTKEVTNDTNHIFSQIEEFLQSLSIQTSKDIVLYFSKLIDFSNQFIDNFFAGEENNGSITRKENDDEEEEENLPEGDIQELVRFLLQSLYAFENGNFQWQLNYEHIAKEEKIKEPDIHILSNKYYGVLSDEAIQKQREEILPDFQDTIKTFNKNILRITRAIKRKEDAQKEEIRQQLLENKNKQLFKMLSSGKNGINKTAENIATEEDFIGTGNKTVDQVLGEIYAEKPEYFNNILLGFNFQEGRFQTTKEKAEIHQEHFFETEEEKPSIPRLQDIKIDINQISEENKQVPMVISGTSFNIVKLIQNNISPITISDEEDLDRWIKNDYIQYIDLDKSEIKKIKSLILARYQKHHAETKEDKEGIKRKTLNQYTNIMYRKRRKLDIDLPIDYRIKKYINDHIWECTQTFDISKLTPEQIEEKIANLPEKSKAIIKDKEQTYKKARKEIETKYFGEEFSLNRLREENPLTIREMLYSRDIKKTRRERDLYLLKRYTNVTEFLDEIYPLDENYEKSFREDVVDFVFLQNIGKFKEIEKQIQENFEPSFSMSKETLAGILCAMIQRTVTTSFIIYDEDNVSNVEKDILDTSRRFLIYDRLYNHETTLSLPHIFEKVFKNITDYTLLEIFLSTVKKLGIHVSYDKKHMEKLLQKGYDQYQYNPRGFGIYEINKLEKIKERAREFSIVLNIPPHSPLEIYQIYRMRTPERILTKESNENFYDRNAGTLGYKEGNLANPGALSEFSEETESPLTYKEIIDMDIREYKNIPPERRCSLHSIVPVMTKLPKVEVILEGNWDEEEIMQGHYVMSYDQKKQLFSLIFDDSLMSGLMIIGKYNLQEQTILGGGFMTFDKKSKTLVIEDRIDKHQHEPRILTITAMKNAIKDYLPEFKVYIGNDGVGKFLDYV